MHRVAGRLLAQQSGCNLSGRTLSCANARGPRAISDRWTFYLPTTAVGQSNWHVLDFDVLSRWRGAPLGLGTDRAWGARADPVAEYGERHSADVAPVPTTPAQGRDSKVTRVSLVTYPLTPLEFFRIVARGA